MSVLLGQHFESYNVIIKFCGGDLSQWWVRLKLHKWMAVSRKGATEKPQSLFLCVCSNQSPAESILPVPLMLPKVNRSWRRHLGSRLWVRPLLELFQNGICDVVCSLWLHVSAINCQWYSGSVYFLDSIFSIKAVCKCSTEHYIFKYIWSCASEQDKATISWYSHVKNRPWLHICGQLSHHSTRWKARDHQRCFVKPWSPFWLWIIGGKCLQSACSPSVSVGF